MFKGFAQPHFMKAILIPVSIRESTQMTRLNEVYLHESNDLSLVQLAFMKITFLFNYFFKVLVSSTTQSHQRMKNSPTSSFTVRGTDLDPVGFHFKSDYSAALLQIATLQQQS